MSRKNLGHDERDRENPLERLPILNSQFEEVSNHKFEIVKLIIKLKIYDFKI